MAQDPTKEGGDWTAGLVAIAAALLLGAAAPIGIYFGLYVPQTKEHEMWAAEAVKNKAKHDEQLEREKRVGVMRKHGDEARAEIAKLEERFTPLSAASDLITTLETMAKRHRVELPPDKKIFTNERVVKPMEADTSLPNGLTASKIVVEGSASYNDFGRFMAEIENMSTATLIPGNFTATGDSNGGDKHLFRLELYMIQRRDLDAMKPKPPAPKK